MHESQYSRDEADPKQQRSRATDWNKVELKGHNLPMDQHNKTRKCTHTHTQDLPPNWELHQAASEKLLSFPFPWVAQTRPRRRVEEEDVAHLKPPGPSPVEAEGVPEVGKRWELVPPFNRIVMSWNIWTNGCSSKTSYTGVKCVSILLCMVSCICIWIMQIAFMERSWMNLIGWPLEWLRNLATLPKYFKSGRIYLWQSRIKQDQLSRTHTLPAPTLFHLVSLTLMV